MLVSIHRLDPALPLPQYTTAGSAAFDFVTRETTAVGPHRIERRLSNDSFGVGEWLQFEIGYGFINAGTATMEVNPSLMAKSR